MNTNNISFEISPEEIKRIENNKADIAVETAAEEAAVATDVTAFSAYNCAWLPPVTRAQK